MTYTYPAVYTRNVGRPKVKTFRLHARLAEDAGLLLLALSEKLGREKTEVVEDAIRLYAKAHNVKPSDAPATPQEQSSGASIAAEQQAPYTAERTE